MFIKNDSITLSEDLLFFAIGLTLIGMFLIFSICIFPYTSLVAGLLYAAFICFVMALILLPTSVILEITGIEKVCVERFNKIKLFLNYRVIKFSWDKLWKLKQNY